MTPEEADRDERGQVSELLLATAAELGPKAGARTLILYGETFADEEAVTRFLERAKGLKVILAVREAERCQMCEKMGAVAIQVPDVRLTRAGQMKVAILLAVSRGLIHRGDRVLCLSGLAESGQLDSLFVGEVGEEFELFSAEGAEEIPRHVRTEVFERVLDLAISLGVEGREGRPVGTIFVLGDTESVLRHSEQLVLNPFQGYPKAERNILDPRLTETIKEYAALDGAFVVHDDGIVEAAGRFLRSTIPGQPLPRGLGARHKSAAAVTAATDAVAVSISESTGNVTVYEQGKILLEIEKPRPIGSNARTAAQFYRRAGDAAADTEEI